MIWQARAIESAVRETFGTQRSIAGRSPLGGGCINAATKVRLDDGTELLLKENSDRYSGLFVGEARGLLALRTDSGPRVPEPYACGTSGGSQFILMEFVRKGHKGVGFWEEFGRRLARLHTECRGEQYGFDTDNHIGSTEQHNTRTDSWIEFFRDYRLGFQIDLAQRNGAANASLVRGVRRLMERLPEILTEPDAPSILHGDLWGGNHMADESGDPVIFDPAVYYGHSEADVAMTELFGGFDRRFYDAYSEIRTLGSGYMERKDLYNLYHVLNHLNIFGGGYARSAAAIVERYS